MLLSELQPGATIQVEAARGVRTKAFDTTVIEVEGTVIKVEPIYQDDKLVGFDAGGIVVTAYVPSAEDGKVFSYNCVSVKSLKGPDGKVYQEITCQTEEGKVANRRGACRIWVGTEGEVKIGDDNSRHKIVVKDISSTGIAIVCDDTLDVSMGVPITVTFKDEKSKQEFRLTAAVVRHEDADHRRIVYGCKFGQENDTVLKYVYAKQRANLKATRTITVKKDDQDRYQYG